jgi:hypothetical protein
MMTLWRLSNHTWTRTKKRKIGTTLIIANTGNLTHPPPNHPPSKNYGPCENNGKTQNDYEQEASSMAIHTTSIKILGNSATTLSTIERKPIKLINPRNSASTIPNPALTVKLFNLRHLPIIHFFSF